MTLKNRKMNKRLLQVLVGIILFITSCAPSVTTAPVAIGSTITPTTAPTTTTTSTPTGTPTASVTPLPPIPTFTPTFDVSTIVTVTAVLKAECPEIDTSVKSKDYFPTKLTYPLSSQEGKILEFLNKGGSAPSLLERLDQIYSKSEYSGGYAFTDVTGDQVPEFLYVDLYFGERPIVFRCKYGKYEVFANLTEQQMFDFHLMKIENLNSHGIPQIVIIGTGGVSFPISTVRVYEWNGETFIDVGQSDILALREIEFKDIEGNGTKEIILIGDNPICTSCSNFIPQREKTIVLGWNGHNFVEVLTNFAPPQYRFQAVQDADSKLTNGRYDDAQRLYFKVIESQELDWWSRERFIYEQTIANPVTMFIETPSVIPTEDLTEYPSLAGYSYYRIMLLQFVQGFEEEASTTYGILQEKFGDNKYGQPYVEMATAFWEGYQSTYKIYDGCAAAIQYAAEHPDILVPLGSDHHGWQSHTYVPSDVCPFR